MNNMEEASNNDADVFVYMGSGGPVVPQDVVRVRVHSSVTVIPAYTFQERKKLEDIELCDGLLEIGQYAFECAALKRLSIPSTVTVIHPYAFSECKQLKELELFDGLQTIGEYAFFECNSLKRLTIPNTVASMGDLAFCHANQLQHLQLPEGIESLGVYTFSHNRCPKCRIPPSITRIPEQFIGTFYSMFSLEISEDVTDIGGGSDFWNRFLSLRNIAIPSSANVDIIFSYLLGCPDLQQLYETGQQLINALKHRFDNLPIHKMIYYQSYNNVTVDQLNEATSIKISRRRSKINPTGEQQDCLGMTPLHSMACSSVQNIELYKVLVNKYPETLVTEDRWGAVPLFYAIWGNAPKEIVQFLVESYKSIYPHYEPDWEEILLTFSRADCAQEVIQKLLDIQQESFPEQIIDWNQVLDELTKPNFDYATTRNVSQVFRFFVKYSMAERISALGPRKWREEMACKLEESFSFNLDDDDSTPKGWFYYVSSKLSEYEREYINLKEATNLIELTLWNNKMTDFFQVNGQSNKKAKIDEADRRRECRINCRADIVIEHVLPYLF